MSDVSKHSAQLVHGDKKEARSAAEAEKNDEIDNLTEKIGNMSAVSEHGTNEACNMGENEETPEAGSRGADEEEDDIYYLTEKVPFFDIFLSKSHVKKPWILPIPKYAHPMLPSSMVPVVLRHGGKDWTVEYKGGTSRPKFDGKWKDFVIENKLKAGDACVFEVTDPSPESTKLKVFILRGDFPPELEAVVDTRGDTSESPIVMD